MKGGIVEAVFREVGSSAEREEREALRRRERRRRRWGSRARCGRSRRTTNGIASVRSSSSRERRRRTHVVARLLAGRLGAVARDVSLLSAVEALGGVDALAREVADTAARVARLGAVAGSAESAAESTADCERSHKFISLAEVEERKE